MVNIKVTKRERLKILNHHGKIDNQAYTTILGRSSISDLNKMIDCRLQECDDILFKCINESIALIDLFNENINKLILDFNINLEYIVPSINNKEDIFKLHQKYLYKLDKFVGDEELNIKLKTSFDNTSCSIIRVLRHIIFICNYCKNRTGNRIYKAKERILVHKILAKLDFWMDYIIDEFFDASDYMLNHFTEVLSNRLLDIEHKENLEQIRLEIDECFKKTKIEQTSRFRSRDLTQFAQKHGYTKIRQKGDHGVFKRENGSTLVIPQGRRIGKGLSLKIQKSIIS